MSEAIHRLVYYSRNRIKADAETLAGEIDMILAASRKNNAQAGVTGALMFNAGCFAQVLEGPRTEVETVFERIQQDERHGEVTLLGFDPASSRAFENWSMGFVGSSVKEAARYGAIGAGSGFDPARMSGDALFEALHRLALEEEDPSLD